MQNQRYFVNVSGEKVPPFAAMQLTCNPKKWKEIDSQPFKSDLQKEIDKLVDIKSDLEVGNMPVIYCTKPNRAGQVLQDASLVAFNGETEVPVSGTGVCSFGAYQYKTLGGGAIGSRSFSLQSGEWSLVTSGFTYGPFRSLSTTSHRVTYKGNSNFPVMMVIPNQAQQRSLTPLATAQYSVDGIGEFPFYAVASPRAGIGFWHEAGALGSEFSGVDALFFQGGESLRFELPGTYDVQIFGTISVRDVPAELNLVPIDFGLSWNYPGWAEFQDATGGAARAGIIMVKYIKTPDGVIRPMDVNEEMVAPNAYAWSRTSFIYQDRVNVKTGGAEMYLTQTGSPYVSISEGVLNVKKVDSAVYGELLFNESRTFSWAPYQGLYASNFLYSNVFNTSVAIGRIAVVNEVPQF